MEQGHLTNDLNFARNHLTKLTNLAMAQDIFDRFPELRRDRNFWRRILAHSPSSLLYALLERWAPAEILTDAPLLHDACLQCWRVLDLAASADLPQPLSFWETLFRADPLLLRHWPRRAQQRQLLLQTLPALASHPELTWDICNMVADQAATPPGRWNHDRELVHAWLRSGLPFVPAFSQGWRHDRDAFRLVARHCVRKPAGLRAGSLAFAAVELRSDRAFVRELLRLDCSLLPSVAVPRLQRDYELALMYFGDDAGGDKDDSENNTDNQNYNNNNNVVENYVRSYHYPNQENVVADLHRQFRDRLSLRETFDTTVLRGIWDDDVDNNSPLTALNQGLETTRIAYQQRLAEYLDVPCDSRELHRLRRACENWTRYCQSRDDSDGDGLLPSECC